MFEPLYVAASGLSTFESEMNSIVNNLSNVKTPGFKKSRIETESLFYVQRNFDNYLNDALQQTSSVGEFSGIGDFAATNMPIEFGTGVKISATTKDFAEGQMEITKNPLDMAIKGEGLFKLRLQDGSYAYTRAGNFHKDDEGNIVDPNGHLLEPAITLPDGVTSLVIRTDGMLLVALNNESTLEELGHITIARFRNPAGLESVGQNLYVETGASGEAVDGTPGEDGFGQMAQYTLEGSNVDILSEMMRMVMTQRAFDTVTKAVQSYEAMLTALQNMKQG